jgi:hypothetical protein
MVLKHYSIADIDEAMLVERVVGDPHWRRTLLNLKGIPEGAEPSFRVPLGRLVAGAQGDVDLLLVAPGRPFDAVAVEVKRFKVSLAGVRAGLANKLGEFKKGVAQANRLARMGFSQTYLWVVVVADTREQNEGQYTYEGLKSELRSSIDASISTCDLLPEVGLMQFEFVQPMDHAPFTLGTYGGHLKRLATARPQDESLSQKIQELLTAAQPPLAAGRRQSRS